MKPQTDNLNSMQCHCGFTSSFCGATLKTQLGMHQLVNNVPPFLAACANINVEMLKYLVSKGAVIMKEVPIWGNSLCIAAEYGGITATSLIAVFLLIVPIVKEAALHC